MPASISNVFVFITATKLTAAESVLGMLFFHSKFFGTKAPLKYVFIYINTKKEKT